jgi:hypothetical protein
MASEREIGQDGRDLFQGSKPAFELKRSRFLGLVALWMVATETAFVLSVIFLANTLEVVGVLALMEAALFILILRKFSTKRAKG